MTLNHMNKINTINYILNQNYPPAKICEILIKDKFNNFSFEEKKLLFKKLNLYSCVKLLNNNNLNSEEKEYVLNKISEHEIDFYGISKFMSEINVEDFVFIYNNCKYNDGYNSISLFYAMQRLNSEDECFSEYFVKNIKNFLKYYDYMIINDNSYTLNDERFNIVEILKKSSKCLLECHKQDILFFSKKSARRAAYTVAIFGEFLTEQENNFLIKKFLSKEKMYEKYINVLREIAKNEKIKMHDLYLGEVLSKITFKILT